MNDVNGHWGQLRQGSQEARDALLLANIPLVHHVARRILRRLHGEVDLNDLVSAGTIGLMNALDTFDPGRGLAFSTFAAPRIRGAILDDLRRWDHVPRSVRRKQRQMADARRRLRDELDRAPSEAETAASLGIDTPTLWRWQTQTQNAHQVSYDEHPTRDGERGPALRDTLAMGVEGEVEERINQEQEMALLRREMALLSERERTVLALYYFERLKLREIAEVLEVTESRVSQIRTRALQTLRERVRTLAEVA